MEVRRKIKIVTGTWGDHVMVAVWEKIALHHDVEMLVLENGADSRIETSLPVVLFPQIPEMQGFYRDLDRFLAGADLVVTIETTRLSSFQALRCAKSIGVACAVVTHEITPMMYERYANIRAIQFDIHQNADLFLASSHRAVRLLQSEGVAKEKIVRIPHYSDVHRYRFDRNRAEKFRKYIGVRGDELMLVLRTSFVANGSASIMLAGICKALTTLSPMIAARVRILVIGSGPLLENLKYEAADFGLGSRTIFMNQDPQPFWRDVVSAAQLIIWDRWVDRDRAETYPFGFMQGLAAGAQMAIPTASVFDEASSGALVRRLDEMTVLDVAEVVIQSLQNTDDLISDRERLMAFVDDHCGATLAATSVLELLQPLLGQSGSTNIRARVQSFIDGHPAPVGVAQSRDLLVKVEEFLLVANLAHDVIAELWRIKGDAKMTLNLGEEAVAAYEKALQMNDQCYRAQRGLGYLAWQGHSHDDAIGFFKRALGVSPNDYHATLGVGLVYRRLRMLNESVFWLEKAVEVGGPESSALGLLVQACVESADTEVSLDTLEHLRASFGDLPQILRGLSQVYLAQGRADEAGPLLAQVSA